MRVRYVVLPYFVLPLVICGAQLAFAAEQEPRKVIASIKPLALITEAIVDGSDIEVEVLLPAGSSPHQYALKISDAKRLQMADLVIWLGDDAEPYINPGKTKNHLPVLSRVRRDLLIQESEGHGDHQHSVDPHIWLDPQLAEQVAVLVATDLAMLYPEHKALLEKNTHVFRLKNSKADQNLNMLLNPYRGRGFLAYHNAYGYFVRRYGLRQAGVIQEQVGGSMSLKHLHELQSLVKPGESICLFREPQFIKASIPDLGAGRVLKEGLLDPLGIDAENYQQLIETLANQVVKCLSGSDTR